VVEHLPSKHEALSSNCSTTKPNKTKQNKKHPERGQTKFLLLLRNEVINVSISECYFFFSWDCGLNSGFHFCKAGALPLEPHLQSILVWLFWKWGSHYLPRLASNCHSSDLSFPSSRITGESTAPSCNAVSYNPAISIMLKL
jgi:hypothetical protein